MATRTLAGFAADLDYDDIPAAALERAGVCLTDTVGVALFGAGLPWSRIIIDYARSVGQGGASTILGAPGVKVHAPLAALANGALSHAFELDSLRKPSTGVHPGAILGGSGFAVGEELGCSGKALLTAFVAGCEVMSRIGAATRHTSEILGFHAPGLTGVFGAAVTAGRLMGLGPEQMTNALGISGSLCSGVLEFAKSGSGGMVKRLHLGRAAEGGVMAATLARDGFTGPDSILEGEFGFLFTYAHEPDLAKLTAGLGDSWETEFICLKRFPCHITAHTPVQGLLELQEEHGFSGADVEALTIGASEKVLSHHVIPEPKDIMAAQYSVPFSAALALYRDPRDPRSFLDGAIDDPGILALSRKVRVEPYAEAAKPGNAWASRVEVRLRDGRVLEKAVDDFEGTPSRPMDDDARRRKFTTLAAGLGEAKANALFESLEGLAGRDSLAGLLE